MLRVRSPQDFGAGVLFMLIGLAGVYFGKDLTYGNAMRMGPGYFPIWLSWILIAMGAGIGFRGIAFDGPRIEAIQLRPVISVLAAILAFGALINRLGLALTVVVLVFIAAYARPDVKPIETALLAVGLGVAAVIVFIFALGQPLPMWGEF